MIYLILAIILAIVVVVPVLYILVLSVAYLIECLIHPKRNARYPSIHGMIRYMWEKKVTEEAEKQQRLQARKREENLRRNREMDVKLTPDSYKAQP